jgi:hypothetical protein
VYLYRSSYYWNFRTSSFKQVACLILEHVVKVKTLNGSEHDGRIFFHFFFFKTFCYSNEVGGLPDRVLSSSTCGKTASDFPLSLKIKWKTVRSLLKFCKNQECFQKDRTLSGNPPTPITIAKCFFGWLIDWLVFNVQRAIFQLYSEREHLKI